MSQNPTNGPTSADTRMRAEEATLTKILHAKLVREECLQPGDRESVSYRIAEIMVAAKELYTGDLPRLINEEPNETDREIFDELAGLRMTFFHLRDLITDFDEAFLDAMAGQREADDEADDEVEPPVDDSLDEDDRYEGGDDDEE